MKTKQGRAVSVPVGLGISLSITATLTIIATAIIAIMINNETIQWTGVGFWIMAVLLVVSFLGGKAAIYAIKTQRVLVSFMSGGLYWAFLLCIAALLFGGNYGSVWETGALITAGSVTAALIHLPQIGRASCRERV